MLRKFAAAAILGGMLLLAFAVGANNVTLRPMSRGEFLRRLDHALELGREWLAYHRSDNNAYMLYMLRECLELSPEARTEKFLRLSKPRAALAWIRLADPEEPFVAPPLAGLAGLPPYQLWTLHAISRREFPLSETQQRDLHSTDRYYAGRATHQLLSLFLLRKYNGGDATLDGEIRQGAVRIAREAALDFRVTDLYLQRIAFLLGAGHADLVKPRWVERMLAAQETDGGWYTGWHGWHSSPYLVDLDGETRAHPTIQALWAVCMLKYRFPQWIETHYPAS